MSVREKTSVSEETIDELVEWLLKYKSDLEKSYSDNAWKYFDHEKLHVHLVWNGYHCRQCGSLCSVKNRAGKCIKCLVLREKIGVIDKALKMAELLKGGKKENGGS